MIIRSTIRRLPPAKFMKAKCDCCGGNTTIKFLDEHGRAYLGECCVENMIASEQLLHSTSNKENAK